MARRRFLRLWTLWSALYVLLAVVGPNGVVPVPVWPVVSQHLLEARAWLGDDVVVTDSAGDPTRRIVLDPRLDVTPYFEHRAVRDPREEVLVANLAVAVRGADGRLVPAQEAWRGSVERLVARGLVCHVGFPPGPAFLLLPFAALLTGLLATEWLGAILGGLAVAIVDRLVAGWSAVFALADTRPGRDALAILAGAGTLWLWIVPDGGTFLFAQTVGTTALAAALLLAWEGRRVGAGLAFGLAITSRPAMLGALPLLLVAALRRGRARDATPRPIARRLASLGLGPALFGLATLLLNELRFGSPWELGYRFMIVPPALRARLAEHGQLSLAFLARNLHAVGFAPPLVVRAADGAITFPYLASDPQGMGVLWVTPAFLALGAALWASRREAQGLLVAAWASLGLACLPGLLYYNTGWVQWGGRFLVDAWPIWLLLAALGLRRLPPRLALALIVASVASNVWAALLTALRVWPGCCF